MKLVKLLKKQLTRWRALSFARKLVKGYAKLCGKKRVSQEHVEAVYLMLYPYVKVFNDMNIRFEVGEQKQIWGAGMELFSVLTTYFGEKGLKGITKYELADELDVSVRAIEKTLRQFKDLELNCLEIVTIRESRTQRTYIRLGKELRTFFENYSNLFL